MTVALNSEIKRSWVLAALLSLIFVLGTQITTLDSTSYDPRIPIFVDPDIAQATDDIVGIIVQEWDYKDRSAEKAVEDLGGSITGELPIVEGFTATFPTSSAGSLPEVPGARVITLDRLVKMQEGGNSSTTRSVYTKSVRADSMWQAGITGRGITVALIDTGIAPVPDLDGRILQIYDDIKGTYSPCQNLSGESSCDDSYGHGTFIAGIIAGNGASSGGRWKGVAPEANLVSVKIAGREGSADVSNVLAAIQWVVSFKDRYGIRVLNLSLGTNGRQSYRTDPLNYAVERAWSEGITVVVSASNLGPNPGTISKPGDDPWVITVGAVDDRGTAGIGDDRIPNFSSRGPTAADGLVKPDVTAPGAHMVSLRAPGSAVDTNFPTYIDDAYRKGSGTSMSAAVVSGSVALMTQADPSITPDRAKFALMATARRAASDDPLEVGRGEVDAYSASLSAPPGVANQGLDRSSGMGSLDASRGDVRVTANDPLSTVVMGTLTMQLLIWDPVYYTGSGWYGSGWYGSGWYGSGWYGSGWYGSGWYGSGWYGSGWYGQMEGSGWYGSGWYGSGWYGAWE